MDLYSIDVTGYDLLSKNYGIIIIFKNEKDEIAFGYKFPSELQNEIIKYTKNGDYGIRFNRNLKPRVYATVVYLMIENIFRVCYPSNSRFMFHICNDFDGHQIHIIERLKCLNSNCFEDITQDNYIFKRHNPKSKIQKLALQLHKDD